MSVIDLSVKQNSLSCASFIDWVIFFISRIIKPNRKSN